VFFSGATVDIFTRRKLENRKIISPSPANKRRNNEHIWMKLKHFIPQNILYWNMQFIGITFDVSSTISILEWKVAILADFRDRVCINC
jgi:hypothetical protein